MRLVSTLAALTVHAASAALADVPRVATDIAPVQGLVQRVMGDLGAPARVVPPSGAVHSYDLRPSEAAALAEADVVFWVGPALTPWMSRPLETLASGAQVVSLLDAGGPALRPLREAGEHDHDHDHGHGDDHASDDQDGEGIDPHAWLDPDIAALWLDKIAESLAAADPDHADLYRANAAAGQNDIRAAATAAGERLRAVKDVRYVLFHDSTQYFEEYFGLDPIGAVTAGDAAAPGPARLADIQDRLAATGAACLMVEPQENRSLVEAVAEASDLRIVRIDPLGIDVPSGADFYPRLLRDLAERFASCGQ